ncbi:MAG: hypothetical protein M3521_13080, partial [Acidobacteriota bacterium]|nr:hypothetical protein [Acidobacteriota bacterium]
SYAQDEMPLDASPQKLNNLRRQSVLEELNLSQTQAQRIRRINQENRFLLREAQTRLREANKNLDAAIYADGFDEQDIQSKIKELQLAQAEMIKLRSLKELAIRRVLEPSQLSKFRGVRQNFKQKLEKRPLERLNRQMNLRNRKFGNRGRP